MKNTFLPTSANFVALIGFSTLTAIAQEKEIINSQKSGGFHPGKTACVGDKTTAARSWTI